MHVLEGETMAYTESEVLQYIAENDVKFIKLFFTDIFGTIKSISIQPSELEKAFSHGISFDASGTKGFLKEGRTELFLVPDPSTLCVLPWRPQHGRVVRFFCNVRKPDGTPFDGDCRYLLEQTEDYARKLGYEVQIGTECEFYLFLLNEQGCRTNIPHDSAGYCDLAPDDKGENVRRDICLTLIDMGLRPEKSHHESGPGQHEIDFNYDTLLKAGDNVATFKTIVKTIAARHGLYADFSPCVNESLPGSGMHINISLHKDKQNIFASEPYCEEAKQFLAGILAHIAEITVFLNPMVKSYSRLGNFGAPKYITWSHENRSQLVRIPNEDGELKRLELRSPDPMCNQYLALSLIIRAGLDGIANKLPLQEPTDYEVLLQAERAKTQIVRPTKETEAASKLEVLPPSLRNAVFIAKESSFVQSVLPEALRKVYLSELLSLSAYC